MQQAPIAAESISALQGKTNYPAPYSALVKGRLKRKLGDHFGLTNFGVNLTHLAPGAVSALAHSHTRQEEFIFILAGHPMLVLDQQEFVLHPGDCYGSAAGTGIAHQLINRSDKTVTYLEIGDRSTDDQVEYPNDDLKATQLADGKWSFTHKDGRLY
jgi:uncharacterized cupin superfamily protein